MVERLVVLAILSACCACNTQNLQARHRLYLAEPNVIRDKRVDLGMSEEVVAKKLGRPAFSLSNKVEGRAVSDWKYVTVTRAWTQADDRDLGVWEPPATNSEVSMEPRLDLLFIDGTLVAIGDYSTRTYKVDAKALGDRTAAEEAGRRRDAFPSGPTEK